MPDCDHPSDHLEAGRDWEGLYILCSKCAEVTRDMKTWGPRTESHYIVHSGSGTYMAADECRYFICQTTAQKEAMHETLFDKARELGAEVYDVEAGEPNDG